MRIEPILWFANLSLEPQTRLHYKRLIDRDVTVYLVASHIV